MKLEDQCAMKPQKQVHATVTGGAYCLSLFHGLVDICCEFLVQVRELHCNGVIRCRQRI